MMATEPLKIVLDTNCLLQILGARSSCHFLFAEFLSESYTLCVSTEILKIFFQCTGKVILCTPENP